MERILAVVAVALLSLPALSGGASAAICQVEADLATPPPPLPTPVEVALTVNEFRAIDEAAGSFTIDFETVVRWRDPRLAEALAGQGEAAGCQLALDEVWRPDLILANLVSSEEETPPFRTLERDGAMVEWQRRVATLAAGFDAAAFPFDSQALSVAMFAQGSDPGQIRLDLSAVTIPDEAGGWQVGAPATVAGARRLGSEPSAPEAAAIMITIPIARAWFPPFISIYLPVLGCTLVALSVYLLPRDDAGNRIAISSTALLIAAAFSYLMADYVGVDLTPISAFFWASVVIPFLSFASAMAAVPLVAREREDIVRLLDRSLLIGSGAAFAVLTYLAWFQR